MFAPLSFNFPNSEEERRQQRIKDSTEDENTRGEARTGVTVERRSIQFSAFSAFDLLNILSCSAYSCHQDTSGRPPHLQLVAEQEGTKWDFSYCPFLSASLKYGGQSLI
nr:unnamed protein product [Callosobruchus analis]